MFLLNWIYLILSLPENLLLDENNLPTLTEVLCVDDVSRLCAFNVLITFEAFVFSIVRSYDWLMNELY